MRDRLWYADWTTGPDGELLTFDERWSEIRARYGPDHLVTKLVDEVEPTARAVVERTERQLAALQRSNDDRSPTFE